VVVGTMVDAKKIFVVSELICTFVAQYFKSIENYGNITQKTADWHTNF
jgi:hypothetical protein